MFLKNLVQKLASYPEISTSDDDHNEGRDGVFCADSFNASLDGESGGNRESFDTPVIEQQKMLHDAQIIGGQPSEEKAVTPPRRSRRRSLARLFVRSSNSDTAVYDAESLEWRDGEYVRSASLPPMSRLSSDVASGHSGELVGRNSLSAFLSFKKKQASLTAALEAFDGKRMSTDHQSCVSSVTMTEGKDGDGDKSTFSCKNVPCQSSTLPSATSSPDHRSDLILPVETVDFDELLSEQRQSPEPQSPLTQVCSTSSEQKFLAPALGSSDCVLSLLHRLRVLSEYTLCTSAAAVAACDTPTTTLIKYYKSMPQNTNASLLTPQVGAHFSTDLKPDGSTDSETSLETLSVDVDELKSSKDCVEVEEGTNDVNPEAHGTDTGIGVEVANGENGVIDVGVEFDVHKEAVEQINAIHDALLDSERHCQTDPLLERASSPRTDILNLNGWSQHHRYARHRQSSSENQSLVVLPLNHMSRALVVNGGGRHVNGLHHGLVTSSSAKDLTELRALTDELRELRNWKVLATKALDAAREELKAMESLRAAKAAAVDEIKKLRLEVNDLRKETSLLTTMLNNGNNPPSSVATEISELESGTIATALTKINETEAEKEAISVEMVLESNTLVSEYKLGIKGDLVDEGKEKPLGRELAEFKEYPGDTETEHNEFILKYESTLLVKDEEISFLKSKHEQTTQHAAKLESALVASNQAKEVIATELNELKVRHATVEIRLEVEQKARLNGNKKLEAAMRDTRSSQEKLTEGESEIQEIKDRLDRCQLANEDSVSQITALQDQLNHAQDCKCQLEQELKKAEESVAEKHQEVSFLAACVKRLQDQLQETEESCRRKLIDERGPRLEENHSLKAELFAKKNEISHLKNDLNGSIAKARKIQDELDDMNLMAQPKAAEIANLREINQNNAEIMKKMKSEYEKMKAVNIDKEGEISFLQDICSEQKQVIEGLKRETAESTDYKRCFEQKMSVVTEERDSCQADAASKSAMISDLVAANNRMLHDIQELSSQKTAQQQTTIASEIFEQRIKEIERELGRQQVKYQSATDALAGMEVALLV